MPIRQVAPDAATHPPTDDGRRAGSRAVSTSQPGFDIAPWELRWRGAAPSRLGLTESVFALSNGHIGLRGALDEGEPVALPGITSTASMNYVTCPMPRAATATPNPARPS